MTQEEKQQLLKDLCARSPYGVKVELHDEVCTLLGYFDDFVMLTSNTPMGQQTNIANIKPYLRSMSSMTEEELKEFVGFTSLSMHRFICSATNTDHWYNTYEEEDWLNEHHFDFRGLIEKGLALEAPEGMYKTE